ncbi:MAG: pyridoxamine 5'-phosphate oxidase family protein [Candidatus Cloacimonadota bacterium]|nr:MAG: pyridoxamine 5'-phosphate oxidase family protein [Candidatus Cloacimonadota bacterium]
MDMDSLLHEGKYLGFLATVDEIGHPHVRPIVCLVSEGKIFFSTKDGSRKAKEIALNTSVEITIPVCVDEKFNYFRVSGKALRILEENFIVETLTFSEYNPGEYIRMRESDITLMYELLPNQVARYIHDEKREENVTGKFFNR